MNSANQQVNQSTNQRFTHSTDQPANQSTNQQKRKPTIIFIFGGSGDLTYRKLLPAVYNLYLDQYLPDRFLIVGLGRSEFTSVTFRNHSKKGIEEHARRRDSVKKSLERICAKH